MSKEHIMARARKRASIRTPAPGPATALPGRSHGPIELRAPSSIERSRVGGSGLAGPPASPETQLGLERLGALRLARRLKLAPSDAEDIVHDALLACLVSIRSGGYDAQRGTVGGWLRAVVRNRAVDHWRRRTRSGLHAATIDPAALDSRQSELALPSHGGSLSESVVVALALDEFDRTSPTGHQVVELLRAALGGAGLGRMAADLGAAPALLSLRKHRAMPQLIEIARRLRGDGL